MLKKSKIVLLVLCMASGLISNAAHGMALKEYVWSNGTPKLTTAHRAARVLASSVCLAGSIGFGKGAIEIAKSLKSNYDEGVLKFVALAALLAPPMSLAVGISLAGIAAVGLGCGVCSFGTAVCSVGFGYEAITGNNIVEFVEIAQ